MTITTKTDAGFDKGDPVLSWKPRQGLKGGSVAEIGSCFCLDGLVSRFEDIF